MQKRIPISAIRVGRRHRKDLGNIRALAHSIQEIGLLHPPVIRPDGVLIAGERRLQALQLLGWKKVPVTIVDLDRVIRGEVAENVFRQDFRPSEMVQIARALEPILRKEAKARQGKRNDLVENFHEVEGGKTRDKLGACVGVSGRTLEKMMAIVDAAEQHPRKFGRLKDVMDRTGKTSRPYRALLRVKDELRVLNLRPALGRFRTLVLDCPWEYEQDLRGWGRPTYATMSVDQLLALPVPEWADENSHNSMHLRAKIAPSRNFFTTSSAELVTLRSERHFKGRRGRTLLICMRRIARARMAQESFRCGLEEQRESISAVSLWGLSLEAGVFVRASANYCGSIRR